MTPATYAHTTATEYAHGFEDGAEEVRWLIADQRAALVPDVLERIRDEVRHSAFPYSRAYALGMLRGARHVAREETKTHA